MKNKRLAIIILLSLGLSSCGWNSNDKNNDVKSTQQTGTAMSTQQLQQQNFLNKKWHLEKLMGDEDGMIKANAYIVFTQEGEQANQGKVSGFSGCNRFLGKFTTENHSLKIGPLGSTRKACPQVMGFEAKVLKVFRNTESFQLKSNRLELYQAGQVLAVFK